MCSSHFLFSDCGCSQIGTVDASNFLCEGIGGQCNCKPGVFGRSCDKCMPGFYQFSASGCTREFLYTCFWWRETQEATRTAVSWSEIVLISSLRTMHNLVTSGWRLQGNVPWDSFEIFSQKGFVVPKANKDVLRPIFLGERRVDLLGSASVQSVDFFLRVSRACATQLFTCREMSRRESRA